MNKEEIQEALRIIKEPITVNTTTYHYFDQENYDKLQRVYDNCQWFINNEEQLIQNIEYQQQELERYKNIIDELEKEKSKKYDYVREVRTFNNNISKKDLEKFPVLKQYQGKDISYIVYESIDIL